ncbi:MAG: hypothetical protein RL189_3184 [Pseudomonadota bacterium]|jgi:hypothetical protein
MTRAANPHRLLQMAFFCVGIASTACVPGEYKSVQLPTRVKQSAANGGTGGDDSTAKDNTTQPVTTQPVTTQPGQNPANPGSPGDPSSPGGGVKIAPNVPEADTIRKCMNLWGTVPFKEIKPEHVKVMDVSVGVGGGLLGGSSPIAGIGNIINIGNPRDLEATAEPKLIIIPLSVNLGGSTNFELMNPNGWYCMKAAVGAKSTVGIKLHCNAKLAQSDLGVSLETNPGGAGGIPVKVGINDGKTPGGQLGIMVDSSVSLTRVNGSGAASCP